jgi:hypothetical protein
MDSLGLNQITRKNQYPPLLFSKMIDHLLLNRYFTKLYICKAYYRFQIASADEWKAMFCIHSGHSKYTVVMFSLVNDLTAF